MKITIDGHEIDEALVTYVASQGINIQGKEISVELTAGRGDSGNRASISIDNVSAEESLIPVATGGPKTAGTKKDGASTEDSPFEPSVEKDEPPKTKELFGGK